MTSYLSLLELKRDQTILFYSRLGNVMPDVHLVEASLQQKFKITSSRRPAEENKRWLAVRIRIKLATFCPKPPEDPSLKTLRGQNQGGDRIWYPSHYHILSPPPFKSHLPGLEVKAVFARQLDILELDTIYLHRAEWFPRNPICTF